LCDALKDHTSLLELDLSDNAFGGRCADAMVPFLSTNTSIMTFKLNNNGLGPTGGNIIASAILANALRAREQGRESKLRVIVCGRNRLENGSAGKWGEAFKALGGLKEVKMPQNGIRMEGIEDIVEGLRQCRDLESLDLQDNTATKTGTRAIVKALPSWPNLRHLNLSDCLISSVGGVALGTALGDGSNPKLESLKLQYGEFDGKTVELLAVAVAQHLKGLTCLELNGNRFAEDDECVEELRKALALHGNEDALDDRE
jgi:Ran GTPase-activating protein 1